MGKTSKNAIIISNIDDLKRVCPHFIKMMEANKCKLSFIEEENFFLIKIRRNHILVDVLSVNQIRKLDMSYDSRTDYWHEVLKFC